MVRSVRRGCSSSRTPGFGGLLRLRPITFTRRVKCVAVQYPGKLGGPDLSQYVAIGNSRTASRC